VLAGLLTGPDLRKQLKARTIGGCFIATLSLHTRHQPEAVFVRGNERLDAALAVQHELLERASAPVLATSYAS
jgi:hypothetical protein